MIIKNWSICFYEDSPYQPPESKQRSIHGEVFGHDRFEDGHIVTTSPINTVDGRLVKTQSGSEYRLGKIDRGYRKYLKENFPDWDWRNPLTGFSL